MAWYWWDDFDKIMCGKWISKQFEINKKQIEIYININYTESGVNVGCSFNNSSCENNALYVEYSNNSLYFFHNDYLHRAEYRLVVEDDNLLQCKFSIKNCFGSSERIEKDLEFIRLEPLSKEELIKYKSSNKIREISASRMDILKEYADYGDINFDFNIEYKFDERKSLLDVINKYRLDEIVHGKNDVETAIALMDWLCKNYKHGNPPQGLPEARTPQALMEAAEKFDNRTNCRGLSLILAQLIRAYNIRAFHVTCLPYEEPYKDCHVVVCVYCESLGKHIMLDPTNNLYIKNKNGEFIGVDEFRDILIYNKEVTFNEDYFKDNWSKNSYCEYMAKNLIRIERYKINKFGADWDGGCVTLIPEKYMQKEAKIFTEEIQKQFITSRSFFWKL